MIEIGAESRVVAAKLAVLDELLEPDELRSLQVFIQERQRDFETSTVLPTLERQGAYLDHGRSRFLRDTGGHGAVVIQRMLSYWPHILRELGTRSFDLGALEVGMAASNDGDFVRLHNDNAQKSLRRRVLTFVYFCHHEPKAFRGGLLRIYDSAWNNGAWRSLSRCRTIVPEPNRLVVFPSFLLHEVTPVECPSRRFADSRFTVNGWICHA